MSPSTVPIRPAATVLLVRDGPRGLEVFMQKRHHAMDFSPNAFVFPGGRIDVTDADPGLIAHCERHRTLGDEERANRVGAIREVFEECGVLLARERDADHLVDWGRAETLHPYRHRLETSEITMLDFVEAEGLVLATGSILPFGRFVTPEGGRRRYDAQFYITAHPEDHVARHDGNEAVESIWIRPRDALDDADAGARLIAFPTRRNIEKLALAPTAADAIELARTTPIVTRDATSGRL